MDTKNNKIQNKEFKVKITRLDIVEIIERAKEFRVMQLEFLRAADWETLKTTEILMALQDFLISRKCIPDFEVDLNE